MPRGPRAAWSGAINFAGFPIHLAAYNTVKSRSGESFKTLDPKDLQPVRQLLVDHEGNEVDRAATRKGVELSRGNITPLDPAAVEAIQAVERTDTIEPLNFAPMDSVRAVMHMALGFWSLVPNEKVPGADGPAEILWNGLKASGRGLVATFVPRAGSRDQLLVVHADEYGLNGSLLPFADEIADDIPRHVYAENEQAAQMFDQFVGLNYTTDDFTHTAYESEHRKRRAEAIEAALKGETIAVAAPAESKPAVPDLMAAMQASLEQAGTKPKAPARAHPDKPAKRAKSTPKSKA